MQQLVFSRFSLRATFVACLAIAFGALAAGCDSQHGSAVAPIKAGPGSATSTPSPVPSATASATASASPTPSATPTGTTTQGSCINQKTATIASTGGSITVTAGSGTLTESFASGQLNGASVTFGDIPQANLPAPLSRTAHRGGRTPAFTAGAGNTYVAGFCTTLGATPSGAAAISGAGVVPTTVAAGTQLNIALNSGGTYVDVGTAVVTASGAFQSTAPTVALPGVTQSGSYLVYVPAAGTNTAQLNLGFALVGDDGSGSVANGLQFIQLEDPSGNAYPTPTTTFFPVTGSDLDGQSLTPDASRGAVVDGGNVVYFFSGIPQHAFNLSPTTVDVTNYGADGDSIASLPNGDEVVVSADGGSPLAVISGILAGNPVIADSIADGGALRDGLVASLDGKVLLSRGSLGLDVFAVAPVAPHAGSTGTGTTSYSFTLTKTFSTSGAPAVAAPAFEDGRDGMAISPADSSRAVVVGFDSASTPEVQLLTGLTGSAPTLTSVARAAIPASRVRFGTPVRHPEPSAHRRPFAVTPSVGSTLYAVSITPDGTTAYVSTDAGILTFSGVNTGTLAQVGGAYSPNLPIPGGGTCPLAAAASIGVLPDGKYLIASVSCGIAPGTTDTTQGSGAVVTIPIGAGGALGAPVGQLDSTVTPFNDQIIFH